MKIENTDNLELKWKNNNIVLYEGDSPLKVKEKNSKDEKDFIIEQEAIICENRDDIIKKLESRPVKIFLKDIEGSSDSVIALLIPRSRKTTEVLNFINFYDENDPVLQRIKGEKGGLYFTIKNDNIYISDKNGDCVSIYDKDNCYQYQYKQNTWDALTISDVSTIIGNLTETNNEKQKFTLQKGEELSDNIYEANVALNDKPIATLPKIGYYMLNDQLVMRNHVTQEKVVIPRDFHYLKVVKFNNDDYKLTFCNFLGNEFFEYKKYDPQYSGVSDEYKFVDFGSVKKTHNLKFKEYVGHSPKFFAAEGPIEPGSQNHVIDLFRLVKSGKGGKVGALADEFGYFDDQNKLHYYNYHKSAESNIYNPENFSVKMINVDVSKIDKFYLIAEQGDIIIHPILENLDIF